MAVISRSPMFLYIKRANVMKSEYWENEERYNALGKSLRKRY
jgi:hypothetical protein